MSEMLRLIIVALLVQTLGSCSSQPQAVIETYDQGTVLKVERYKRQGADKDPVAYIKIIDKVDSTAQLALVYLDSTKISKPQPEPYRSQLQVGEHRLEVSMVAYEKLLIDRFTIEQGDSLRITIALQPSVGVIE